MRIGSRKSTEDSSECTGEASHNASSEWKAEGCGAVQWCSQDGGDFLSGLGNDAKEQQRPTSNLSVVW